MTSLRSIDAADYASRMNDQWSLYSRIANARRDTVVSYHATYVRAVEAASRLWRQGREPSQAVGPSGERKPKSELEAAIAALYKLEARCETCNEVDCNRLQRAIAKHGRLPWAEFLEAAASECSRAIE